jgi:hypothetical protein
MNTGKREEVIGCLGRWLQIAGLFSDGLAGLQFNGCVPQ